MRTPSFFILGAPKCGTTAIAQYLSSHPAVYLSSPKEPHFFDANYQKGLPAYLRTHYSRWNNEQIAGEATPSYLSVPYVAERIHQDVPGAKLIVILRNPIERAFSSWWMFHIRGMEPLDFADAIAAEEKLLRTMHPLDDPNAESLWKHHVESLHAGDTIKIPTYLYNGFYARHIQRYIGLFGTHNIKVVFSHQLRDSPDEIVRDLWEFLGVDTDAPLPEFESVNEALGASAKPVLWIIKTLGLMRLRHLLPASIRSRLKKGLSWLGGRREMDSKTSAHLGELFEPQICELESLLGEDLSVWRR